jgi:hypothetical protein
LNSSKKWLFWKICIFSTKFNVILTDGSQKAFGPHCHSSYKGKWEFPVKEHWFVYLNPPSSQYTLGNDLVFKMPTKRPLKRNIHARTHSHTHTHSRTHTRTSQTKWYTHTHTHTHVQTHTHMWLFEIVTIYCQPHNNDNRLCSNNLCACLISKKLHSKLCTSFS